MTLRAQIFSDEDLAKELNDWSKEVAAAVNALEPLGLVRFAEGDALTTASTTYVGVVSSTFRLPAGRYKLEWYVETTDENDKGVGVRVDIGSEQVAETQHTATGNAAVEPRNHSGFWVGTLQGELDVRLLAKALTSGDVTVTRARFALTRVG